MSAYEGKAKRGAEAGKVLRPQPQCILEFGRDLGGALTRIGPAFGKVRVGSGCRCHLHNQGRLEFGLMLNGPGRQKLLAVLFLPISALFIRHAGYSMEQAEPLYGRIVMYS